MRKGKPRIRCGSGALREQAFRCLLDQAVQGPLDQVCALGVGGQMLKAEAQQQAVLRGVAAEEVDQRSPTAQGVRARATCRLPRSAGSISRRSWKGDGDQESAESLLAVVTQRLSPYVFREHRIPRTQVVLAVRPSAECVLALGPR